MDASVIRRRAPAPPVAVEEIPAPVQAAPPEPVEVAPAPAPVEVAAPAVSPVVEPAPVVEVQVEAPAPEPPPAPVVVEAPPVVAVAPPVAVEAPPPAPPAPPAPEPVVVVPEPPRPAPPVRNQEVRLSSELRAQALRQQQALNPSAPVPPDPRAASRAAHMALANGLPRADQGRRPEGPLRPGQKEGDGSPRLPGLGKAVVRPPPGYDPNDPLAFRRRAPETPAPAPRPTPASGSGQGDRMWREGGAPAAPPPAAPGDDRRRPGSAGPGAGAGGPAARPKPGNRRARVEMSMDELGGVRRGKKGKGKGAMVPARPAGPQSKALKRRVQVDGTITVGELAHAMSVKSSQVIKYLLSMGRMATQNEPLDLETAQIIASEFDHEVVNSAFQEDEHLIDLAENADVKNLRPPVVTIMGHVDHGKTTLLDAIRKAKVAASEAGGITQHIGAYQAERNGQLITFIDTPGHEAFSAMRARGAKVTDIVVLVVAADDGVMPQTVEAINHAKAANVQILVAVNKIDKANANPQRVKQSLMEYHLVPEEYGGDTLFVEVSALKGRGIDELLDAILLVAEVGDYRANPDRHAEGTVLEARLERGRGPVASVLVQKGTLKLGDTVVMGTTWGRVRAMSDYTGARLKTAEPSTPVEVSGLEGVPQAGDDFVVVESDKDAKTLAEHRADLLRRNSVTGPTRMTLEDILARRVEDEKVVLNLVIKADMGGSLEALKHAFSKIDIKGTELKVLHAGVGAVTESDVTLAHTYKAIVMGFNVRPDAKARAAADQSGVEIRTYNIIYEAIEDVEKGLKGLLAPTYQEKLQGTATILKTFSVPKIGTIAGCLVGEGKIVRSNQVRLLRDGKIVWTGRLGSLKRFKDDVREVEKGYECGMSLDGFNDLKIGDMIESFSQEEVPVT